MCRKDPFHLTSLSLVILLSFFASAAEARVVRIVVEQQRTFAEGMTFGTVGPYERLDGTVYMEVDPSDPLNAVIVNLDKAPRNARGLVEFSSTFYILKPVDQNRGNGKILYGVNNRGNKLESGLRWNYGGSNNPLTAADAGDGFLMRLGYTIVDAGWQGDIVPGDDRLFPNFPIAVQSDGRAIVASVRVEFSDRVIPTDGTFTLPLKGSPNFRPYPAADLTPAHSTLTVRTAVQGPKTPVSADRWAFGRCPTGQASLMASPTAICLFDGFQANRLYELIYPAKDPIVMGLGYAVTRDVGAFLRYHARDDAGNRNPIALSSTNVGIRRAYASGTSSTGMYMRDFIYLGFNEDEAHRKVFDAISIQIPGTHRLFANVEFADPNVYSRQDIWHDSLSFSYPPLTFAVTTDPISGIRDGILKRPATDPLVFQTDSANEFWQMNASLNVSDGKGRAAPIPDNVRLYFASSFDHGGGAGPLDPSGPRGMCQNQTRGGTGNSWAPTLRALLVALDEWADKGITPPKSNYPSVQDGTLVELSAAKAAFPAIPGVSFPTVINELSLPNFGSGFNSKGGRLTQLPPVLGSRYQLLVPKPDNEGLDIAGIRPMEVAAPTGTITGWNVRAPEHRGPDLCGLSGSFIPFAETAAQRRASGDPRASLEERYGDHAGFVKAVEAAARKLVNERFLLQEDAKRYIQAALTESAASR